MLVKSAKKIVQLSKLGDEVVTEFQTHVVTAHKTCGQYAQTKLPLCNQTLTSLADIDPGLILSQKFGVLNHLIGLLDLPVHVLDGDEEHEGCNKELCKLMQGNTLPACKDVRMAMR